MSIVREYRSDVSLSMIRRTAPNVREDWQHDDTVSKQALLAENVKTIGLLRAR